MQDGKILSKQIPVKWVDPDSVTPRIAQNMMCSYQEGVFLVSFFETWQPQLLGNTPEEKKRELDRLSEIEAKCVAKIVVTPKHLQNFIRVLNESVAKAEKLGKLQEEKVK